MRTTRFGSRYRISVLGSLSNPPDADRPPLHTPPDADQNPLHIELDINWHHANTHKHKHTHTHTPSSHPQLWTEWLTDRCKNITFP